MNSSSRHADYRDRVESVTIRIAEEREYVAFLAAKLVRAATVRS